MADSRDKPEIETLSYKPASAPPAIADKNTPIIEPETKVEKDEFAGQHFKLPKPLKRGFLGLNAHVIKPETRINKTEDAGQHFEQPKYAESVSRHFICQCGDLCKAISPPAVADQHPEQIGVPALADNVNGNLLGEKELKSLNEHMNKYGFLGTHCPNCGHEWSTHNYDCDNKPPEQPNQMIITEIEGLVSQANEKMYDLPIHPTRSMAIEEIDILLRITIKKQLREAFE